MCVYSYLLCKGLLYLVAKLFYMSDSNVDFSIIKTLKKFIVN